MPTRSANDAQLTLGLPDVQTGETALRRAWRETCSHRMSFERAMATPAIAIGLRNIAAAYERQQLKPIAAAVAAAFTHPKGELR